MTSTREALKTPPKGNSLKIKKDQQIVDSRPSKEWLKRNKLMIIKTVKDKDGKTRYILADTFDS